MVSCLDSADVFLFLTPGLEGSRGGFEVEDATEDEEAVERVVGGESGVPDTEPLRGLFLDDFGVGDWTVTGVVVVVFGVGDS